MPSTTISKPTFHRKWENQTVVWKYLSWIENRSAFISSYRLKSLKVDCSIIFSPRSGERYCLSKFWLRIHSQQEFILQISAKILAILCLEWWNVMKKFGFVDWFASGNAWTSTFLLEWVLKKSTFSSANFPSRSREVGLQKSRLLPKVDFWNSTFLVVCVSLSVVQGRWQKVMFGISEEQEVWHSGVASL